MSLKNNTYGIRTNGVQHGDVYTKRNVVQYMLDLVGYTIDKDLSEMSILEPSCGTGEFLMEIVHRLKGSSLKYGFDLNDAFHRQVLACEIDGEKVRCCIERMQTMFPEIHLPEKRILEEDFLLGSHQNVDIVVGNPPYIRYEQIPVDKLSAYKKLYNTFYYRADMYVLFFEHTLRLLKSRGRHCFICANRWLKNCYGKNLRAMVVEGFSLLKLINLEGADVFDEEVLAYPAITLIENGGKRENVKFAETKFASTLPTLNFKSLPHPTSDDWSCMFVNHLIEDNLSSIEEQGFTLGIGVATGADNIFISKDLKGKVEDSLLIPVIGARDLKGNQMNCSERYLLNPYNESGTLVSLNEFPLAKVYLNSHYERLSSRHKARRNPVAWYGTIDKINPRLRFQPKILLPDISGNSYIFVDSGRFYPQHNIYYITGGTEKQLKILAALLMSDFVVRQLGELTNRMSGGMIRWQCQYLRKLLIPTITCISEHLAESILDAYNKNDKKEINRCVDVVLKNEKHRSSTVNHIRRSRPIQLQLL